MALDQPPGVRSCRGPEGAPGTGGTWTHVCGAGGLRPAFFDDLELYVDSLSESDRYLYKRELLKKMQRAAQGLLRYGKDAKQDDVYECVRSRNQVLEMRHDDVSTVDDSGAVVERHARLYFTERSSRPRELLSISFRLKLPGPIGLEEQNRHIDEACGRLAAHEFSGR